MNLSLKERYKLLGKIGDTFVIIYYLILFYTTTYCFNLIVNYRWVNVILLAFLILLTFNICTLWKLNKFSFWSSIISLIVLIFTYGILAILTLCNSAMEKPFRDNLFHVNLNGVFFALITVILFTFFY